ncbi:MAG: hypothetical protein JRJ19_04895 [Deltaproteobacteria bacterium]|nr:hypothetical protein [Deltaproteobacteria bacterium]MBW1871378.1 hypothetical protein [Deltaproteobacteria bacterium]
MVDDHKPDDKQPDQTGDVDSPQEQGSLSGDGYESEDILEGAEPWEPIETKIVLGSFGAAIILLVIFALLINKYILN